MPIGRMAVIATVAIAICGAAYIYRGEIAQQLGMGTTAKAAVQAQTSPAAQAQPQGTAGATATAG